MKFRVLFAIIVVALIAVETQARSPFGGRAFRGRQLRDKAASESRMRRYTTAAEKPCGDDKAIRPKHLDPTGIDRLEIVQICDPTSLIHFDNHMTQRIIIAALFVAFIAAEADAQNRRYRRRGAILGGLAGAAIGVAIGDKGNNETAGALIGGAVGAIAGGTIGNQRDRRIEHNQRYHSGYYRTDRHYYQGQHFQGQQGYQPGYNNLQPAYPAYRQPVNPQYGSIDTEPTIRPVTVNDVIQMRNRGLDDATMIRHLQVHGVAVKPTVSQIIDMHEQGVSERVIAVMQGDPAFATDYVVPPPPEDYPTPVEEIPFGPSIVGPSNGQ